MELTYDFTTDLWQYPGEGAWIFITVPNKYAPEIKSYTTGWMRKGFGSIKVEARIADIAWKTSIFPDKKSGSYLMPVKKDIRRRLGIEIGDTVSITLKLQTP